MRVPRFLIFRHEDTGHAGAERIGVHRPVEHQGRDHAGTAQSGLEGDGLPATEGNAGARSLDASASFMAAGHAGGHAALGRHITQLRQRRIRLLHSLQDEGGGALDLRRSAITTPELAGVPCTSTSCRQRIALAALTPNRSAACRHDSPPSTAATTWSRARIVIQKTVVL